MTLRLSWKKPYFNSNSIFQVTILATAFGDEKFQALWRKMLSGKKLTHFSAACRCHVAGCPPLICLISGHISPFWCYTSVLYSLTRSSVILHSICFEIPLMSISQKHSFMQQQKEHLRHPGLRLVKLLGLPTKLTIFAARFCQFLVFFRCPEGYPGWKKKPRRNEARLGPPDSLPATDCCRAFGASDTTHDLPNLPNIIKYNQI